MRSIRRARGLSLLGRPDPGDRPDEPARRVDLRGEGDAGPVRRPGDLADAAVAAAPDGPHPAAVDGDQPQGRRRVVVGRVGPDEGDGPPVGRDPRARVADDAAGQDPRPGDPGSATVERHGQQVSRDSGSPWIVRRTTTAVDPSRDRSSSSTTTWRRMSAGVIGGRSGRWAMAAVRVAGGSGPARPLVTCPTSWDGRVATLDRDVQGPPRHPARGRRGTRRRAGRRRPRIDAHQPRPARTRRTSRWPSPRRPRSASPGAVPATVAVMNGRVLVGLDAVGAGGLATAPAGSVQKAARPTLAEALAWRGLGGDHRLGDDDRGPRRRDRRLRHGRHRRRPSRGARRARFGGAADARHLVGPRGARPHARWRSSAPARRPSSTSRPRSSTSRRAACRSSRSARRRCPGSTPARRASGRPERARHRDGRLPGRSTHLGHRASVAASSSASRRPRTSRSPTTGPGRGRAGRPRSRRRGHRRTRR